MTDLDDTCDGCGGIGDCYCDDESTKEQRVEALREHVKRLREQSNTDRAEWVERLNKLGDDNYRLANERDVFLRTADEQAMAHLKAAAKRDSYRAQLRVACNERDNQTAKLVKFNAEAAEAFRERDSAKSKLGDALNTIDNMEADVQEAVEERDEARTAIKCTWAVLENIAEFGKPIGFDCEVPELAKRVAMDFGEICGERDNLQRKLADAREGYAVHGSEMDRLENKLKRFAAEIVRSRIRTKDHACAQCCPAGDLLVNGFVCVYHEAVEYCDHEFADTKHCVKCGWVPEK